MASFLVQFVYKSLSKEIISCPLADIMNLSIQTGVFPTKLKQAKVKLTTVQRLKS